MSEKKNNGMGIKRDSDIYVNIMLIVNLFAYERC